jgi:hypothetical protein
VTRVALFLDALFIVPWLLDFVLPTPSGDLSSFLVSFVPLVWTPTILALLFVQLAGARME